MSLSHKNLRGLIGAGLLVAASAALTGPATAEETELQTLRAPFTCGSEWSGVTRPGHGLNDWNLDLNRTSRTYSDPQHDLGQPLLAQADGTIVWIGWHSSAGTYVEIDYGDITARYIHVVDHSVPEGLEIGSPVVEGQLFGLLGDTGNATHAHLHLEYFDSREYDDARAWLLPAENQIRIAMDGEIIDPGEVFTSTNCDGEPIPTTTTTPPPHPFTDVDEASFAHDDIVLLHDWRSPPAPPPPPTPPATTSPVNRWPRSWRASCGSTSPTSPPPRASIPSTTWPRTPSPTRTCTSCSSSASPPAPDPPPTPPTNR
jgi:hypothetical protein